MFTINVPTAYVNAVRSSVSAFDKKAKRIGITDDIIMTCGSPFMKPTVMRDHTIAELSHTPVTIIAPFTIQIKGYEFLAKLTRIGEQNLVIGVQGVDVLQYRDITMCCDHCNVNRLRNVTFVVRNVETQEVMQVGSSCVNLFLKEECLKHVVARFQFLLDIQSALLDEERNRTASLTNFYAHEHLLAQILCFTNKGVDYLSRKKAEEELLIATPTAFASHGFSESQYIDWTDNKQEYYTLAKQIIQFVTCTEHKNDFLINAQTILNNTVGTCPVSTYTQYAIICSLSTLASRFMAKETTDARTAVFLDMTEKQRARKVQAKLVAAKLLGYNQFGPSYIYVFEVEQGEKEKAVLSWFTGTEQEMDVGTACVIDFTIKKIEEYKNQPNHVVTRVKIH